MARTLSHDELARVHEAQAKAQARSHARFALVVTPASDRYPLYPLIWAAGLALLVAAVLALVWPHLAFRMGVLVEVLVFAAAALLFDWWPLRVHLVPRRVKHAQARALAHLEFCAHVLAAKDRPSGLLFFVSLAERYVELIADRELHARVGEDAWNRIVANFTAQARAGHIADGFVEAANACADLLEAHFPAAKST